LTVHGRRKGAVAEREVAAILASRGFDASRNARNGVPGAEDVAHAIPGVWLEVKRQETLWIPAWVRQAEADARDHAVKSATTGHMVAPEPVVVFRQSRQPWRVVTRLDHYLDLVADSTLSIDLLGKAER
jgi:Holliday junction resolvase